MTDTLLLMAGLLIAALAMFVLEILTPSFGILAAVAIGCLVGVIYFAFTLNSTLGAISILVLAIGIPLYLVLLVKKLPKLSIAQKFFLKKSESGEGAGTPDRDQLQTLVGKEGETETGLRPSGVVRVEGQRVHALAESGMLEKGTAVKVIRSKGTDVVVRRIDTQD